jgi:hypothetical protein
MRYLIIILILSPILSFAQTENIIIGKIKYHMKMYSVNATTKKVGTNATIYFNNSEKIIDIDGYQIPLLDTKCFYRYSSDFNLNVVSFECFDENECVTFLNGSTSRFSTAFTSKKSCYSFIDLIAKLKRL